VLAGERSRAHQEEEEYEDESDGGGVWHEEERTEDKIPWVRGRLKERVREWRGLTKNTFVLSVIEHGYKLEWKDGSPPPCEKRNAATIHQHEEFVNDAIAKLVERGAIQECRREEIKCVLAMDVKVNATGDRRLCVDGRPVNYYEKKRPFKYESLGKEGRDVFAGQRVGAIVDISHAYHHMDMHKDSRKYLGIKWGDKYYMWFALPFGLQSAPWCFCTVVGEPVKEMRKEGISLVSYMDDFPHAAGDDKKSKANSRFIINLLRRCGFIIEPEKKCLGYDKPLKKLRALGFVIDFEKQEYVVPDDRRDRALELARELIRMSGEMLPPKRVSCFAGMIVSMSLAIGGVARIQTRALYRSVGERLTRQDWKRKMRLSVEAVAELRFWVEHFDRFNGRPIVESRREAEVDLTGSSDASDFAYGGFVKVREGDEEMVREIVARAEREGVTASMRACGGDMAREGIEFRGEFTEKEMERSSTWREGARSVEAHGVCGTVGAGLQGAVAR
jgi:hypothetical protein